MQAGRTIGCKAQGLIGDDVAIDFESGSTHGWFKIYGLWFMVYGLGFRI